MTMGNTVEWTNGSVEIEVWDSTTIEENSEVLADPPSPVALALYNGCSHVYVIEDDVAGLRRFERAVHAAVNEAEQMMFEQRSAGFRRGEVVHIGNGRKRWTIKRFDTLGRSDAIFAILEATDEGYTSQSAEVSRLVRAS
jgi:hypothetical protein